MQEKQSPNPPAQDFSEEVRLHRSPVMRGMLVVVGTLSLVTGIVGIFLPVLPTTPFLLLAAACYANSSVRFYNWLMNQKQLGPYIRRWRNEGTIPLHAKLMAIALITITIGISVVFFVPVFAVRVLLVIIALGVIVYLFRIPSSRPEQAKSGEQSIQAKPESNS